MKNKNLGGIDKYINKIILADYRDIIKEIPDKCIDLILTDPPYGGECEAAERGRFKKYESENYIKARRTGEGWAKKYGSRAHALPYQFVPPAGRGVVGDPYPFG